MLRHHSARGKMTESQLFDDIVRDRPRGFDARSFGRALRIIERVLGHRYDRPSAVTRIACEIGAEIIEGLRAPGAALGTVDLAGRHETSRTPIRDALMLLEKEGLIEMPPRRKARVATIALSELGDIYRVRAALFEAIVADVVQRATPEDQAALARTMAEMRAAAAAGDLSGFVWSNVDFYALLSATSRNRTAARLVESLLLRTLRYRRRSLSLPGRMHSSLDRHAQILDAIAQRDTALAKALIRSNHLHALRALEEAEAEGPAS